MRKLATRDIFAVVHLYIYYLHNFNQFYYIFFAGKNITSNRQFSVDNSLGLSDDLGLLFDSGDGCDFSINARDLSEEAELAFCVHRMILMIYPELNITNESRNLTVDVSQACHPHVSAFLRYIS